MSLTPPLPNGYLNRSYVMLPTIACAYVAIFSPLFSYMTSVPPTVDVLNDEPSSIDNKIFWPAIAIVSIYLSMTNISRSQRVRVPSGLAFLTLYLVLSALSTLWSANQSATLRRVALDILVVLVVVLPVLLSARREMVFSDVFCCFLGVCLLNVVFVFLLPSTPLGHAGYYSHKNTLGANAAIAFVLSIHEIFRGGIARRGLALSGILISLFLLLASQSKTSLGLAVICPALGIVIVSLTRFVKISPVAIIIYLSAVILSILIILSDATGLSLDDVSLLLFGDDTFTGRTIIWSFVSEMIELRPWFGWGYQSFWGSGPQALSRQAPDWVASMPQGHNGYLDTALDTGILGLGLLLGLLISGLHGVGTVVKESPRLGCLAISLMLFTILHNGLETTFMRASATLWILFIVVVALVASADEQRRPAA